VLCVEADWLYSDGQTTTPFHQRIAGQLEKAFQEKTPTWDWKDQGGGGKHSVTFATMSYQHSNGKQFTVSRNQRGAYALEMSILFCQFFCGFGYNIVSNANTSSCHSLSSGF